MVGCPRCGAEVQPDWDWCHACGWNPDAALPVAAPVAPSSVHPEVLRSELVPLADDPVATTGAHATARPGRRGGAAGGYVPAKSRSGVILAAVGCGALVVVVLAVVFLRGSDPAPVTTDVRPAASAVTTVPLALTPWLLPEGGFKVDLPTPLAPAVAPDVPAPFVSGVTYTGAVDGRTYLVTSLEVHPAYEWEDLGRAMIDAEDGLAAQHGFAVTSRKAGAFKEMSSNRFTFVPAQAPDETEAAFAARVAGPATGEGIALVTGNHLFVVLVEGTSLTQAQFAPVMESIVVV